MTVAEARALTRQEDLDAVANWPGSQNDVLSYAVRCVVCGAPNEAVVHRHNFDATAKYLCGDCEYFGWCWMGTLTGEGTVSELNDTSTLETEATHEGDSTKVAKKLFVSGRKMQKTYQNPCHEYKAIRMFPDDTLLLPLRKCKAHKDRDESMLWELWIDKKR